MADACKMDSVWRILDSPYLSSFGFLISILFIILGSLLFKFIMEVGCISTMEFERLYFEDPKSLERVVAPSIKDPPEKYISLIIPAFNEEYRLPGALEETMNYLQQRAMRDKLFTYEVLIVDDGSSDGTKKVSFDAVRNYSIDNVRVILLGRNHGKGEAIRQGMIHSRGELLLMLDADGATQITDLQKLEEQIYKLLGTRASDESSNHPTDKFSGAMAVAFGSRAHLEKQALATRKWYRNVLMKGFHLVVMLAAGRGIRDTQCGFKMFTRAAAKKLFTNMRLKRWCFDVELVYLCKRLNIPMVEVSVTWSEIPGSKMRLTSILHMLYELALLRVGYSFGFWKIHHTPQSVLL